MINHILIIVSTILLLVSAVLAIRLIWITGRKRAWILMAFGISALLFIRVLYAYYYYSGADFKGHDIYTELFFTIIAFSFFAGTAYIGPIFKRFKQAEQVLSDSEKKYKTFVQNAYEGIVVTQGNQVKFVNDNVINTFGYTFQELSSRPYEHLIHPDDMKTVHDFNKQVESGEESIKAVVRMFRKDGDTRQIHVKGVPMQWENEPAILFFLSDITESNLLRKSLEESEVRYRTLFEKANDSIFLMREDTFVDCNPKTLEIFDCTRDQILKKPPYYFSPETQYNGKDSKSEALIKIDNALSGNPQFFEWKHKTYAGKEFDAEVSLNTIELSGELYIQAIVRDTSKRKQVERQLKDSIKEKDILLKELHHRVKNNLQLIDSLLALQTDEANNPMIRESFQNLSNRIRSISFIHEQLFLHEDYSKIDIKNYINTLLSHLLSSYIEKTSNIKLESNIEESEIDIGIAIPCGMIINELVTNAIKHGFNLNQEGIIEVGFTRPTTKGYELTVWNNGKEVGEDFDLDNPKTLGLQLINTLVNQIGGKINTNTKSGIKIIINFDVD